jgi:hypothetical protein
MLATNRRIYVEGLEAEKKLQSRSIILSFFWLILTPSSLAGYQVIQDKCLELHQQMSAEAVKENRALKCTRRQIRFAKVEKGTQLKRFREYQQICKSITSAKIDLACKQ